MKKGEIVESWETSGVKETERMKKEWNWENMSECKQNNKNKINEIEVVKQEIWTQKRLRGVVGSLKAGSAKVEPGYDSSDTVLGETWGRIPITSVFMWSDNKWS